MCKYKILKDTLQCIDCKICYNEGENNPQKKGQFSDKKLKNKKIKKGEIYKNKRIVKKYKKGAIQRVQNTAVSCRRAHRKVH